MTDENLFKDSDCDIEAVPVVDFDFIPSDLVCETIPTPAPIFSCVAPVIIPEPPTDVGVECPVFSTTSKIEVGYKNNTGGDSACTVAANPSATLQITKTNVDPCDYEINLDINVPIPRPPCLTVLQGGSFNAQVGFAECVPPGASIQINRVDVPGDCETPDECQYTIDLDIGVPIPRIPCPELRLNTFTTTSGYENCINSAENRFDIVAVHREPNGCDDPGQCEFEIDLQIAVPIPEPPCPVIFTTGQSTVTSGYLTLTPPLANTTVCVAVIDEDSSYGSIERRDDWESLRSLWPDRPFFLLMPGTFAVVAGAGPNAPGTITLPPTWDGTAITVNRDDGVVENATDWYEIIKNSITPGGYVALFVDTSGSMNLQTVEASFNLFLSKLAAHSPPITEENGRLLRVYNNNEKWIAPFISFPTPPPQQVCTNTIQLNIASKHTPATCDTPPTCEFSIDTDISVALPRIPCPELRIGNFSVQSGYEYCLVEPENKFTITTKHVEPTSCQDAGQCAFEVDLQLAVPIPDPPCPTILPGTINVKSGFGGDITYDDGNGNLIVADTCAGENSITITTEHTPSTCDTPAKCEFQVGLDIFVPVPRVPCPVIQTGNVSVISGYDLCVPEIENKLEVITRHVPPQTCDDPGSCAFDINLQIGVPIPTPTCPTITISKTTLNSGFTTFGVDTEDENVLTVCEGSYLNVTVVPIITPPECDKAPGCEFSLEFDANVFIPRTPCPVLNVTDIIVNSGYLYENRGEDCIATENRLLITPKHQEGKDCSDPGQCEFDIELEISVPIPKPPCPIIAVQKFEVVSGYPQCITDKQNVLKITTDHKEGVDCNDPGSCEFGLELELAIPIPEPNCPEIYVKSTQVRSGLISEQKTPDNKACQTASSLIITKTETKDCNGAPRCEFALEFDLGIFVPRVPCPNIVVDSFKVATAFEGCTEVQSGNVFSIIPRHIPGESCDDPGFCEFGVTLEVAVPIPRPVCPVIYVKEFVVNTKIQSSTQPCITEPNEFTITPKIVPAECPTKQPTCEFETTLRLNVPIPEIPCPQININNFVVKSGFNTGGCTTGNNVFQITPREIPGDCTTPKSCAFDLDLEIFVPVPKPKCPNIQVGRFNVSSGFTGEGCETGTNSFTVEKIITAEGDCETLEECEFFLNLDIAVPIPPVKCPAIGSRSNIVITATDATEASGNGFLIVQSGAGCGGNVDTGSCDTPPECLYNIVLGLDLQIPKVCDPKLVVNSSTIDAGYDRPTFFLATATYTPRPECLLSLDMDLSVNVPRPPCPDIIAQVNLATLPSTAAPYANINVASVKVPGEYCNYNILLNLGIPAQRPCPQFLSAAVDANWSNGLQPEASLSIQQTFFSENCVYVPILTLRVPKPKCPYFYEGVVEAYWLAPDAEPHVTFDITYVNEVNNVCQYEYNLQIGIPKLGCPKFVPETMEVVYIPFGQQPYLESEILEDADNPNLCKFRYYTRVFINPPTKLLEGIVQGNWAADCTGKPDLQIDISAPDANGTQVLDAYLTVPTPPEYIGETWTVENSAGKSIGSATSSIPSSGCRRGVGGHIILNTPLCKVVTGTINAHWTVCDAQGPDLVVNISEPDADGVQTLDIDLSIPRPPEYVGGVWSITDSAGNNIGTGGSSVVGSCDERLILGNIQLSTVTCPQPANFTALPTAEMQTIPEPQSAVFGHTESDVLAAVVKNLQLDRATGKPKNPAFYGHMKAFFKQIQEETNER